MLKSLFWYSVVRQSNHYSIENLKSGLVMKGVKNADTKIGKMSPVQNQIENLLRLGQGTVCVCVGGWQFST